VQLSRLVIEAAWRVDLGSADTLHGLFVEDGSPCRGRLAAVFRRWVFLFERPAPGPSR
jgi:hypothetical protein